MLWKPILRILSCPPSAEIQGRRDENGEKKEEEKNKRVDYQHWKVDKYVLSNCLTSFCLFEVDPM